MIMEIMQKMNGAPCPCGKPHEFKSEVIAGVGVINKISDVVKKYGAQHPYIISDKNTFAAGGKAVCDLLDNAGICYSRYTYSDDRVEPEEKIVGSAFMHMPKNTDMIIAVGSGVINDVSKILAMHTKYPYIIVGTAPSMDGYASMSSSVMLDGIRFSLPSQCADVIIGDANILMSAPNKMRLAGIGDMLAKYVSICEWRIAALICGEYYCDAIADLIRQALACVVANAKNHTENNIEETNDLFAALSAGSIAMNYAGNSRPASGVEHYISHVIDMRSAEFGDNMDLHGIQCAIGTLISIKLYEKLKKITPDKERALKYAAEFDLDNWNARLRTLLGNSAEGMIELEMKEKKYDKEKHKKRLDLIIDKWDEILKIIDEELPSSSELELFMKQAGIPTTLSEINVDPALLPEIFRATKDIRDKYVLSRLLWDLGLLDEFANEL